MWRVAGAAAGMLMVPKTRSFAASFFRNGDDTNVAKLRTHELHRRRERECQLGRGLTARHRRDGTAGIAEDLLRLVVQPMRLEALMLQLRGRLRPY